MQVVCDIGILYLYALHCGVFKSGHSKKGDNALDNGVWRLTTTHLLLCKMDFLFILFRSGYVVFFRIDYQH